ncbi:unnamed protein product [Cuscuta epithymum]|uniref:Cytochrome P450 n=1 Tax=Cuscuta epithymum TaxID=186058 RepID=A0AAV0EYY6_9ASTE|nr:unnamed protein product [Cuscuta epithymum]
MEVMYCVTLVCMFVLFLFLSLYLLLGNKKDSSGDPLPPGRSGWPFIGETFEFLSTGWKGHPEKFIFDRMEKYSSAVFRTHLMGEKAAVFCGANGNKFLFSNENKLMQAWWPDSVNKIFPSTSQTSLKEESLKMRKMLPTFFKPEALQRYVGIMDDLARRHFADGWESKNQVHVLPLAKRFTFSLACRIFIGVEDPVQVAQFSEPFDVIATGVFSVPIDLPWTPFRRAIQASELIRKELLAAVIKQRKRELAEGTATASQDILSHMLVTSNEDGTFMAEWDIADKILGLLIGGHDTASSACAFVVKYLAELPHVYQRVYTEQMEIVKSKRGELLNWEDIQNMKYSWNVACEVLRLAPPLQGSFREALTDFTFKGFRIPKGWKLYWSVNSTHKNPEVFKEPEKFDPTRFEGSGPAPYTYLPFGGGPRMCPGKEYARLEILVFMHNLVKRFKWEQIIPQEKIVFDPMPRPAMDLPIRLYPHNH